MEDAVLPAPRGGRLRGRQPVRGGPVPELAVLVGAPAGDGAVVEDRAGVGVPPARVLFPWSRGDANERPSGSEVDVTEVAPASWDALNGSMEASKPWTRATGAAATASRERDSVPLPTEEVAVMVWDVEPAEAGVPESTPVDASRERPEGRAGETDQVTRGRSSRRRRGRRPGRRGAGRWSGPRPRGTGGR